MPLMKKSSKGAFEHNVKAEMDGGKPQDQSLAIAYEIKRKAKRKKMAAGGITANEEGEANADNQYTSESMAMKRPTSGDINHPSFDREGRSTADNSWTPEEMRMGKGPMSPRSNPSDVTANQEGMATADNQRRRPMAHGGITANEEGRATADNAADDLDELMMFANGGEVVDGPALAERINRIRDRRAMADGGMATADNADDGLDTDMMHQESSGGSGSFDEDENRRMASGGSVADKIRRKRMAAGGQVSLEDNSREDLNNEDQMSYRAGLKEQYDDSQISSQPGDSNEHGDDIDSDEYDHLAAIRRKMKLKRG